LDERALETLRWERRRIVLSRPLAVAAQGGGVLVLVALQHFDAGPMAKAFIAGASFIGLMLSPLLVSLVGRLGLNTSRALQVSALAGAIGIGIAGATAWMPRAESFPLFFFGVLLAIPLASAITPLLTAMWHGNLPDAVRGRHFAGVTSLSGAVAVVSSFLLTAWMRDDVGRYGEVLIGLAILALGAAWAAGRIPPTKVDSPSRNPYAVLSLLWREPGFGAVNFAWFLLGFGNLATVPLRVEYLAGPEATFGYRSGTVLLLTLLIPQIVGLGATLIWGRVFDRFGFLELRILTNLLFAAGILLFFTPVPALQVAGALVTGIGFGGEAVIWGLWVTRYATKGRTADYMAVHGFLTGVRGLFGPIAAYALIERFPLVSVTRIGVFLILLSALLFARIHRSDAKERRAESV
jgi:MFS family permease